jgi:hypothetical protein
LPVDPWELQKLQLDYAWKWFSYHADQRVKMFNYMLIVFGIFAAGLVNALDKNVPKAAAVGLAFFAGVLALIFSLLDRRNRDLVWLGEDVLKDLERTVIFQQGGEVRDHFGQNVTLSILTRADPPTQSPRCSFRDARLGKHRVLLPLFAYVISVAFFAIGIVIWACWKPTAALH